MPRQDLARGIVGGPTDKRLPGIHGLRALAATGIVLFHLAHVQVAPPDSLAFIKSHFGLAVPLFFVLSGFSLCYSTADHVGRPRWVEIYLIKRFFRIAPLFYAVLVFTLAFFAIRHAYVDIFTLILNLTFTYNFIPGKHEGVAFASWTIGVEMIFYAILPILFIWVRRTVATLVLTVLGVAISVSARALLAEVPGLPPSYANLSFIANVEYFVIGILAFHVFDALRKREAVLYHIKMGGMAGVFLVFVAIALVPSNAATGNQTPLWGLLFGVLCVWQGLAPGVLAGSSALVFLGERSYSIYLLHPLALFFLSPLLKAVVAVLSPWAGAWSYLPCSAITLAVVYAFASLTYALIEEPGMRVGARLVRRTRSTAALRDTSTLPVSIHAE